MATAPLGAATIAVGLLLGCRSRIGRDFPHPTADDFDRIDKDVAMFEQIHNELLLGCT